MEKNRSSIILTGCIHGNFDAIYNKINSEFVYHKAAAVVLCGDTQTLRTVNDFASLAVPNKYKTLGDFSEYYNKRSFAPILTLVTGGNHENYNLLSQLPFGGWLAPNIFYMGRFGVFWINNVRILSVSGIFKANLWNKKVFERLPLVNRDVKSIYAVRKHHVFVLSNLKSTVDLVVTHDWPFEVTKDKKALNYLLKYKPFLKSEIQHHDFGNPYILEMIKSTKPKVWAAAHMHINLSCNISANDNNCKTGESSNPLTTENQLINCAKPYSSVKTILDSSIKFIAHDKPKKDISMSLISFDEGKITGTHNLSFQPYKPLYEVLISQDGIAVDLEWLVLLNNYLSENSHYEIRNKFNPIVTADDLIGFGRQVEKNLEMKLFKHDLDELKNEGILKIIDLFSKTKISFPDYERLDYTNPQVQTQWFLSLLDYNGPLNENINWK